MDVNANGMYIVELDWKLANGRHATLVTHEQHLRFIMDESSLAHVTTNSETANTGVDMSKLEPNQPSAIDQIPEPSTPTSQVQSIVGSAPKDADVGLASASGSAPKMEVDLS